MTRRDPRLYADVVRSVRPSQLAGRLKRRLPPAWLAPALADRSPAWRPLTSLSGEPGPDQFGPVEPAHETGSFAVLGTSRPASAPDLWTESRTPLLFRFYLHSFRALRGYAAAERTPEGDAFWAEAVRGWLRDAAEPARPAWHPYPTSLRIVAWVAALSTIERWPQELRDDVARQVDRQARYLRRAVETDIGGNHVLLNAVAISLAGLLLGDGRLRDAGLALLRRELRAQVLPDGGHFERSPAYHLEVEELLALLAGAAGPLGWLDDTRRRMRAWSASVAGPAGDLPLLNDAWETQVPVPVDRPACEHLPDTGLAVVRSGGDQLLFDAGPLSPAHLPAHAHADALSFVLWADGGRVVVDPGAHLYTGPTRDEFRGTAAHDTIAVDGSDQCVLWGDFRASRLPRVGLAKPRRAGDATVLHGWHDGFCRLSPGLVHERIVVWVDGDGAVVVDRVRAAAGRSLTATLTFAPECPVQPPRAGPFEVQGIGQEARWGDGWYSPHLGRRDRARTVTMQGPADGEEVFGFSLLRPHAAVAELRPDRLVIDRRGTTFEIPLAWR